jgi:type IV pilus assembly protein PilY1
MTTARILKTRFWRYVPILLACLTPAIAMAQTNDDIPIAQKPLILGSSEVPGNLFLVPSIEWPTMNTVANPGSFNPEASYVGYFNSSNCYVYQHSDTPIDRHWEPTSNASSTASSAFACDGADEWSGNFLNWAATQNIDPFRRALMGGYRFKDTASETWLQKAKHSGQGGTAQYPDRSVTDDAVIDDVTPFDDASEIRIRIEGIGNTALPGEDGESGQRVTSPMRFWLNGSGDRNDPEGDYDPSMTDKDIREGGSFDAAVRVEVCNPDAGGSISESLCREYPNGNYKPEGLIQEFARLDNEEGFLRYSLFSYFNDNANLRDGGVMRAQQKYLGPNKLDPSNGETETNPNNEWNPQTGVFIDNPDDGVATATSEDLDGISLKRSGIVNYLGSAGQTNTNNYKSKDPVSELYYAVNRYIRNLAPVDAYQALDTDNDNVSKALDDFPIVTEWDDPLEGYACSANAAVTIGDVFTHHDKNLPGNPSGGPGNRDTEPDYWSELSDDVDNNGLNVVDLTNKVGELEDGLSNTLGESIFTGRENSAYIAGLAYDMNTRDQRSDLTGDQRVSTYAIDVFENQDLVAETDNQYYLAAKYGGFDVPLGFDPDSRTAALPDAWWSSGESVTAGGTTYDKRPENFFLANQPQKIADSLRNAFKDIATNASGSSAAVAANSTDASTDTILYQAQFNSADWSGDVNAFDFNEDGTVDEAPLWQASNGIPAPGSRDVFTIDNDGNLSEVTRNEDAQPGGLTSSQWSALNSDEAIANYLLFGVSDQELRNGGGLRDRPETVLGDIVNSPPAVASGGNFGYIVLPNNAGNSYRDFLTTKRSQDDVLYIGANDGMLHAFNAEETGGSEQFTFLPDAVFDDLPDLADTNYSHQKYVDGRVEVADAYWGNPSADWGEALVAATGGGPETGDPAVFALDVTRSETSGQPNGVLWELTTSDSDHLGHVLGEMSIVRMNSGEFAAVFGNGYNSNNDEASLFVVPLADPSDRRVIKTGAGTNSNPNGLGGVSTVDLQGDGIVDWVYAGDLHGNMWRFDVSSDSSASWHADKLFAATGTEGSQTQPITAAPRVTPHSQAGIEMNVLFGTGKLFEEGDNSAGSDPVVQSFYSIKDDGSDTEVLRSNLVSQTIQSQNLANDPPTRTLSDNLVPAAKDGWFIDLNFETAQGERVVDRPVVVGNRVFFLSQIPEDSLCGFGGQSWLMEMNAETGARTPTSLLGDVGGDNIQPKVGGISFDQLASGLNALSGDGIVKLATSLADGTIATEDVKDGGSGLSGRISWEQLE